MPSSPAVGRGERLVQRDSRADERHGVVIGLAHHAAAADVEALAGLVEDRRLLARRRMKTIPSRSAICGTRAAVWFGSLG